MAKLSHILFTWDDIIHSYFKGMDEKLHNTVLSRIPYLCPNPGPRLNIKTVLSTYGDFHVKDKTAGRTSYL